MVSSALFVGAQRKGVSPTADAEMLVEREVRRFSMACMLTSRPK